MAMIKAPFNFVPLSDKVFFPEWADIISQDIPFKDGVSGVIELKLTAQTPVFVRNGHTKEDAEAKNNTYSSFSTTSDNRYFIPATTIKGCIRNVLEIMSFGKMTQVDNASFGLRDLGNKSYTTQMRGVSCGWLQYTENGYQLFDWGEPGRISVEAIDKKYGTDLTSFVRGNNFKEDENKTAQNKYQRCGATTSFKMDKFTEDVELQNVKNKLNPIEPRKFYKFGGNKDGVLVFTGQPSQRKKVDEKKKNPKTGRLELTGKKKWTGKYYEFVFLKPENESAEKISDTLIKEFKTIHAESPDFKDFWAKKLQKGERIPVFFKKNGTKIHSIGLAYMYKYPFKQSVFDAIPKELKNTTKHDLAECLFGYIAENDALRGRVHFGNAFAIGTPNTMPRKEFVSGTPHPSFYPLYVENGNDWDKARRISGRKRYPVRNLVTYDNEGNSNMVQICSMLDKGVHFSEKISFHNLKPVELGALLSAITFHGMNNICYHNLGFGKAYGYGKIKVSDINLNIINIDNDIKPFLSEFENLMCTFAEKNLSSPIVDSPFAKLSLKSTENKWLNSIYLQELFAMAKGIPNGKESYFQYLKMSTDRKSNEFLQVKKNREFLKRFTQIAGINIGNLSK